MRSTSRNKWFFIGVGFFAVFVIIVAIIITSKVSEYNNSKDVVVASSLLMENTPSTYNYAIFT